ncbi:MAG: GxxExxY protein [Candidatus Hydrogenedentes bacterium]|nr:GxxExxY protein [Candidatus Hydrogenedentota bacterium]
MGDLIYEAESYAIRGACYEVHNEKGSGFVESVYQECLEKELRMQGIPFVAQVELRLTYKGEDLDQTFKPDLLIYDKIVVELKAVEALTSKHRAQVMNYLKATGMKLAFLVNFSAHPKVEIVRIVL